MANRKERFTNVWMWLFAALLLGMAGEEISWGQRIFQIGTPKILSEVNVQKEINIHNLKWINGSIRAAGLLFVIAAFYIIPITNKSSLAVKRWYERVRFPICPVKVSVIVTIAILFMAVPRLMYGRVIFSMDEMGELFLALGFLVYSVAIFRRVGA